MSKWFALVVVYFLHNCLAITIEPREFNDVNLPSKKVAVLVENHPRALHNALNFVQSMIGDNRFDNTDFWLLTFNSTGVSPVWSNQFDNFQEFHQTLKTLSSQSYTKAQGNNSLIFFALLKTAQDLPKNSVIIVFSGSYIKRGTYLEKLAAETVLMKEIKVFNETDPFDFDYNRVDKNVTLVGAFESIKAKSLQISGGFIGHQDYEFPKNVSTILTKRKMLNVNRLTFPVDPDVIGLHLIVRPVTTSGLLVSPSGYRLSFSRSLKSSPIGYSKDSYFENNKDSLEIHVNFSSSLKRAVGFWNLRLENNKDFYNVSVFAFTDIHADVWLDADLGGLNTSGIPKDVLKLGVTGKISHITDISVLDSNGETVLGNLSYKFNNNRQKYVTENRDNASDTGFKEVNIEIDSPKVTQPAYALITGKDTKGNLFQRVGYIFNPFHSDLYPQQSLTVEVGLGSELITTPGKRVEIYFEVTNQGSNTQVVRFSCSDRKYILHSLSGYNKYLEPKQSATIILSLITKNGNYQDEITFSAISGFETVQKKVLVDVGATINDQRRPELNHIYLSDCTGVIFTSCDKGSWTVEISARDTESGLLQVNTIPKGIFFPNGYTSGTKDTVIGHYSESCCNPHLQISAVDRMNNIVTYNLNAYNAFWSPGAIAGLVCGLLLLIVLIVVIVYFAKNRCKCRCKTKESYDLPTYRGGGI